MFKEKASPFKICDETIQPGESVSLALHLPELYSCLPAYMPIRVYHGKKAGPCLLVFAAVNGDELNGIEVINRLVRFRRLHKIAGTLIAVPVVNVFALSNKSKFLPGNVILGDSFPGSATGTHADRLAHLFISQLFDLADYAVSLETGPVNYSNFPETLIDPEVEENKKLAEVFGAPVVSLADNYPGTLSEYAKQKQKKFLTYTAGEANRFDSQAIKIGFRGILNLMNYLDMISNKGPKTVKSSPTFFFEKAIWVRSSTSGISTNKVKLGQRVNKKTILCDINDPFAKMNSSPFQSPREGIVVGINNVPLVKEGDALFKLAIFSEPEKAASELSNWRSFEQQTPPE